MSRSSSKPKDARLNSDKMIIDPIDSDDILLKSDDKHGISIERGFKTMIPSDRTALVIDQDIPWWLLVMKAFNWACIKILRRLAVDLEQRAMFDYACHKAGIDENKLVPVCPGGAADIDAAFRAGEGQYVQQQGPFPQQLEADGVGHIVAKVGPVIGPCGFSSLAAKPEWLETDKARAFTRAYRKARKYLNEETAQEIAKAEAPYFPDVDKEALEKCIESYQGLGCWTPHIEITEMAYQATLDIFEYNGLLDARYPYERVCCLPPES